MQPKRRKSPRGSSPTGSKPAPRARIVDKVEKWPRVSALEPAGTKDGVPQFRATGKKFKIYEDNVVYKNGRATTSRELVKGFKKLEKEKQFLQPCATDLPCDGTYMYCNGQLHRCLRDKPKRHVPVPASVTRKSPQFMTAKGTMLTTIFKDPAQLEKKMHKAKAIAKEVKKNVKKIMKL